MKPHFDNQLSLTPNRDGRTWKLDHGFGYYAGQGQFVLVPAQFKTDLASIPQIFWNILPPFGKYTGAAVIHDWCYRTHLFPRSRCDAILFQAMGISGVPLWQRLIIYLNVRAFGWLAWRNESRWQKHFTHLKK